MRKVLFDTNIILDIILEREPFFEEAVELFELIDEKKISAFVSATTITDIYYIVKKVKGHQKSHAFISDLVEIVNVVGIDKEVVLAALSKEMKDFEDAIQLTASELNEIEYIITRNKNDFKIDSSVQVFLPKEFLSEMSI
ncbi:type II toxin-antitoxin system VapC family toxin [Moheibacter lacus]|uniref:PIN domain-containing protein n=1 Tax=Moheibacter lacus TaxID=2745851 RepID=A0A838ZTM6_9FLAO|nr:PIN domain-containing protein [Moheibacter lacus]MBA5630293.1 PIN domain-containing protein [Moheibacter lacus]